MLDDEYRLNIKRMLCNLEGRPAEIDNFLKNLAFSQNPSEATEYAWEIIQKMYEQESLLGLSDYGLNPPGSASNDFPPDEPENPEDDDSYDTHHNDNDDDESNEEDDGDNEETDGDDDSDDESDDNSDSDEDESDENDDSDDENDDDTNENNSDEDSDEDDSNEDNADEDDGSDENESDNDTDEDTDENNDESDESDANEENEEDDSLEDNNNGEEDEGDNEGEIDDSNKNTLSNVKPSVNEPVSRVNREIKASKKASEKVSSDKHKDNIKKQKVSQKTNSSLDTEHLISVPDYQPKVSVNETVVETQNNDLVIRIPEDMRDVIKNGPVYLLPADTGKDAEFRVIQLRVSTDENLQQARKIHQEIAEALEMEKKIRDNIFAQLQVFKGLSEQLSENVEQASEIRQMLLDGTTRAERFLNNDMLRLLQQRANEATNEFYQESKDHYNDLFRAAVKRYKQFTQAAMEFQDKMSDENEKTIRNIQSRVNMIQNVVYFLCVIVLIILALTVVFKVF